MGITIGLIVMLAGLADLIGAFWFFSSWWQVRDYGYGTPLYARGRVARRLALLCAASAVILIAVGRLTPLWRMEVA